MRLLMVAVLLAVAISGSARGGDFEEAVAASGRGAHAEAAPIFRRLAEAGDVKAAYRLGLLYRDGHGVDQDDETARQWLEKAADAGSREMQRDVAKAFDRWRFKWVEDKPRLGSSEKKRGKAGVSFKRRWIGKYLNLAKKWFEKAANAEDPEALYSLGLVLKRGREQKRFVFGRKVRTDRRKGFEYIRRSAELGYAPAQAALAAYYFYGDGEELFFGDLVKKNPRTALEWALKAAGQGNAGGQQLAGNIFEDSKPPLANRNKALMWYIVGVESHCGKIQSGDDLEWKKRDCRWFRSLRGALAQTMTRFQIDQAKILAAAWLRGHPAGR
jgi:uncharacterized protein